jgi:hypothetical protein
VTVADSVDVVVVVAAAMSEYPDLSSVVVVVVVDIVVVDDNAAAAVASTYYMKTVKTSDAATADARSYLEVHPETAVVVPGASPPHVQSSQHVVVVAAVAQPSASSLMRMSRSSSPQLSFWTTNSS